MQTESFQGLACGPYDGYDESDDTREKAGTVRLEKALPVKCL